MSGWLTPGFGQLSKFGGLEQFPLDTLNTQGAAPESAMTTPMQMAAWLKFFASAQDKTMVAGTRYYSSYIFGNAQLVTGISVLVGSTGGADSWLFELHDPNGVLLATTTTSGTTAGTANLFQQIAFTAPYQVNTPGTYYLVAQSNGTTAKLGTYASPGLPIVTGSAAGTFGTGANFTPATTYTANLGPIALIY